ncbi:hypothetical protein CMV_011903 [Castanea mollissima]|uniref:Ribulose-phosphate 3-epimerase n=1 Tax=Castanea mollissima TaxID=60419 RepID=A0A8J4R334_9ROSI|nr:hypothetical protein CMV_011903 [Castanea mollissima]
MMQKSLELKKNFSWIDKQLKSDVGHCAGGMVVVKMFIVETFCLWFWKSVSGGFGVGDVSAIRKQRLIGKYEDLRHLASLAPLLREGERTMWQRTIDTCHIIGRPTTLHNTRQLFLNLGKPKSHSHVLESSFNDKEHQTEEEVKNLLRSPLTPLFLSHRRTRLLNPEMGVAAKIAPSMLSSDFANLASEAKRMLSLGADWLHMDIMDG